MQKHEEITRTIVRQVQNLKSPAALHYSGFSNTVRTKSYKTGCAQVDCSALTNILRIDRERGVVLAEPRVTMAELIAHLLPHGLTVPVVPELKQITVGGAIMGTAGESSSHKWGGFHDVCRAYEIVTGKGELVHATREENSELFHGIAGSYGSLGLLTLAEVQVIPAKKFIRLDYHFTTPLEALELIRKKIPTAAFLDGIVFSKDRAVVIEGAMQDSSDGLPQFKLKRTSDWYYFHVAKMKGPFYQEVMPLEDYYFRYDQGAFWMGGYLTQISLFKKFLKEGIFRNSADGFNNEEIARFSKLSPPSLITRLLLYPYMNSKKLWSFFHKAEEWIQDRFIIQDFCIPSKKVDQFLKEVMEKPATFPMWLCPIKGTHSPEIFTPHLIFPDNPEGFFINVGVYGLPAFSTPLSSITGDLEKQVHRLGGRKVLYSRSYYTHEEFWKIYDRTHYEDLREKSGAKGVWKEITEKVLSI